MNIKITEENSVLLKTICAAVENNISGLFMFIENKRNIMHVQNIGTGEAVHCSS